MTVERQKRGFEAVMPATTAVMIFFGYWYVFNGTLVDKNGSEQCLCYFIYKSNIPTR